MAAKLLVFPRFQFARESASEKLLFVSSRNPISCHRSSTLSLNLHPISPSVKVSQQMCQRNFSTRFTRFSSNDNSSSSNDTNSQSETNTDKSSSQSDSRDLKDDPDVKNIIKQFQSDFGNSGAAKKNETNTNSSSNSESPTGQQSNSTSDSPKDEPTHLKEVPVKKKTLQDVLAEIYQEETKDSASLGYSKYRDSDAPIIYDVDEEREILRKAYVERGNKGFEEEAARLAGKQDRKQRLRGHRQSKYQDLFPASTDSRAVLTMPGLVTLLKDERVQDLAVISIPKEKEYADYLIVGTGRNAKHLMVTMEIVRLLYKELYPSHLSTADIPTIEGSQDKGSSGWLALDIGNIVLHLMTQEKREYYDLETLWTVGPEFDDLTQRESAANKMEELMASVSLMNEFQTVDEDEEVDASTDQDTKLVNEQDKDGKGTVKLASKSSPQYIF